MALNVAQNGQDYVRRPLRFHYYDYDDVTVNSLHPTGGPATGGTAVEVTGQHIGTSRGGLKCQFGTVVVHASTTGPHSIRCIAPALNVSTYAPAPVRVTINGDEAVMSQTWRSFTYFVADEVLSISSIFPQSGPSEGGTAITLAGHGFRDLGGVFCRFGVSPPVMAETVPPPPPPAPAPTEDGSIRLKSEDKNYVDANGRQWYSPLEGRVEILHDGVWGTVCDDFWGMDEARVVCRQLGFGEALAAIPRSYHGAGSGQIWLDNVRCDPAFTRLDECASQGWGVHDCDHMEDAGVRCAPPPTDLTESPPPTSPPPPTAPWDRLDDYQLMRGPDGAHIGKADTPLHDGPFELNSTHTFNTFVCRTPPLDAALGKYDHRAVVRTVEVFVTINNDTYGPGIGRNYTYYTR